VDFYSERADEIFTGLYGEREIAAARERYVTLADEFNDGEAGGEGDLRVFCAPGRTELAGNHTDHNRGKVLAASVQLDNVAVVRKRGDTTVFFRSAGFPDVHIQLTDSQGAPDLLPKPAEEGTTDALVRGIAAELHRRGCAVGGFSANANSTVFPGSGLSSSAAMETLLGRIFDSLYGEGKRGALEIAQIGQIAENDFFGKPCGLMDQIACASGGAVAIDFADKDRPAIQAIKFDLAAAGYALCVVNTGGSHANLTADYAAIPAEMHAVAAFFGKSVLGELAKEAVLERAADIRAMLGDRALLRAIHFFDENTRVDSMTAALTAMDSAADSAARRQALDVYLGLVNESGHSSWELLQNVYSSHSAQEQGVSAALALTRDFLRKQKLNGASRVHGGGFAGTIQAYLPLDAVDGYRVFIEAVFGAGAVTVLRIRGTGAVELG